MWNDLYKLVCVYVNMDLCIFVPDITFQYFSLSGMVRNTWEPLFELVCRWPGTHSLAPARGDSSERRLAVSSRTLGSPERPWKTEFWLVTSCCPFNLKEAWLEGMNNSDSRLVTWGRQNAQDWVTRKKWFPELAGIVDLNQQEEKSLLMEEEGKKSGKEWIWITLPYVISTFSRKPNEREPGR